MRVKETFLVMRQAPFGHDGAAARNDAGDASGGERDVTQQHPGMDGEIIHALLALLDERVAINFPGQFFGFAADFFQRLVNRHRADRHGRVAQNPFARFMNVFARGKIHHRVRAPLRGPTHLFDFFLDARGHGAELPIFALIFTRKLRPMIIGSLSG